MDLYHPEVLALRSKFCKVRLYGTVHSRYYEPIYNVPLDIMNNF
jgi:hypothetical protein